MTFERRDLDSSLSTENCWRMKEKIEMNALQPWREWAIKGSSISLKAALVALSVAILLLVHSVWSTLSDGKFWGQVTRAGSS